MAGSIFDFFLLRHDLIFRFFHNQLASEMQKTKK
jgi:hypothetical protein